MSHPHLRVAVDLTDQIIHRPSVRVSFAARDLDCDISTIYKLAKSGQLAAHYIGARSVRIYADSLRDYKEKRPYEANKTQRKELVKSKSSSWRTPAQREAEAYLTSLGCM